MHRQYFNVNFIKFQLFSFQSTFYNADEHSLVAETHWFYLYCALQRLFCNSYISSILIDLHGSSLRCRDHFIQFDICLKTVGSCATWKSFSFAGNECSKQIYSSGFNTCHMQRYRTSAHGQLPKSRARILFQTTLDYGAIFHSSLHGMYIVKFMQHDAMWCILLSIS